MTDGHFDNIHHTYDIYVDNPFVYDNHFREAAMQTVDLPQFTAIKDRLPQPYWANHPREIDCYWTAWELAFSNIRNPKAGTGFISPFIDTAFNDCIFMWDSVFMMLFARYAHHMFNFIGTLDNFYTKQHPDGFICREISYETGRDKFFRFDTVSTGPNLLAWVEWIYYQQFGDRQRLEQVFAPLVAYHQWLREYRTWRDGSYWTSGLGSGMDNQPRVAGGRREQIHSHGHQTWVDINMQQILSASLLLDMADVLKRQQDVRDLEGEIAYLRRYINKLMWDDYSAFYYDLTRDGTWTQTKTIGAYWALLADIVPSNRLPRFVDHLRSTERFNRPHRVPSLSADHPQYRADGEYWLGGVWSPTNYMILRGLTHVGEYDLAHEIACNHLQNVVDVYAETGTLWENYAPETNAKGNPAKPDFVGWTGLAPIAVLLEYVFGLQPYVPRNTLVWDVRLLDEHGVRQYPFGTIGTLDLHCAARTSPDEKPTISVDSPIALTLELHWAGGVETIDIQPTDA